MADTINISKIHTILIILGFLVSAGFSAGIMVSRTAKAEELQEVKTDVAVLKTSFQNIKDQLDRIENKLEK